MGAIPSPRPKRGRKQRKGVLDVGRLPEGRDGYDAHLDLTAYVAPGLHVHQDRGRDAGAVTDVDPAGSAGTRRWLQRRTLKTRRQPGHLLLVGHVHRAPGGEIGAHLHHCTYDLACQQLSGHLEPQELLQYVAAGGCQNTTRSGASSMAAAALAVSSAPTRSAHT